MTYPTIEITPAQVRAARTAAGQRGCFRERFNVLPPNVDARTSLARWDARVRQLAETALLRWGLVE